LALFLRIMDYWLHEIVLRRRLVSHRAELRVKNRDGKSAFRDSAPLPATGDR
jgi:hypothetical protein